MKAEDLRAVNTNAGRMIDGIIFDKDGTLFDFRKSWSLWAARLLADLTPDVAVQGRLAAAIGYLPDSQGFAPDSPVIADTPAEIAAVIAPYLPDMTPQVIEGRMNALAAGAPMTPAVPLRPLLTALRGRGLRLGLATNDTEAPARAHMEQAGITDLMDMIMGCDSGFGGKPAPGMLLAFARHTGIVPARIAMVGDSLSKNFYISSPASMFWRARTERRPASGRAAARSRWRRRRSRRRAPAPWQRRARRSAPRRWRA